MVGVAHFGHEGIDDPRSNPDPRARAPLGQGGVGRLVPVGLLVNADQNMDGPIGILEPFRRPYVVGLERAGIHLRDQGPILQIGA